MKNKIDKPFFEKFNSSSVFFESDDKFHRSIMTEIANILSSRLKIKDEMLKKGENPFSYGVRDFQSINTSENTLQDFMEHCKDMILKNEPRISDIDISDITINNHLQTIELNICVYIGKNKLEDKLIFRN